MKWTELKIESPDRLREAISNYLMEQGAEGVWEEGSFPVMLRAYFPPEQAEAVQTSLAVYLDSLRELYPRTQRVHVSSQTVVREEWAEKWKEFFKPQALGEKFFLIPKWRRHEGLAADRMPIVLDPGMAFGTGLHESTRLCVELLERLLKGESARVLDAGTGSGILAIVAHKLGAGTVTAVDVDPVAVEVAEENCADNDCPGIKFDVCSADKVNGEFDVIVANILLEAHMQSLNAYRETSYWRETDSLLVYWFRRKKP
ncbi:MAG: 50S ribosomal protein L11 methyltransferase [Bdellovibrionota bacterium]